MNGLMKSAMVLIAAVSLGFSMAPLFAEAAEGGHASGHTEGGHSTGHAGGESGKGKGPMYKGGNSAQADKGGSHHHDGSTGGSKSTEDKIFHGHEGQTEPHEDGAEHGN